ncbi:MerR family transcriptional regulator [Paenibacillus sp. 481]|uniref:MerR family transcriptional regulator n=1 Tax=Paenibacillus sp. 481 TaxID=2835869 RepID=UPI001E2BC8B7|nr:MerR family transcriptional regulator [Paenibacillus sp. 481]UHA75511.1 MerR family transcriptional regulator [Paenibacillus sp. 481]
MYTIGKVSKETNISIRTLHYYDEIGLLNPSVNKVGHRIYVTDDMMRLQHITALKKLGFKLAQIKELLGEQGELSAEQRWKDALDMQTDAVYQEIEKLRQLQKLLHVTRHAVEMTGEVRAEDIFRFIKALHVDPEERAIFREQNFTTEEREIIEQLPDLLDNDERSRRWAKLLREARVLMDEFNEPPDSPRAQQFAETIVNFAMEVFQDNEELADKYWEIVRPQPGESEKVYGLSSDVMVYMDRLVNVWLQHNPQEAGRKGSGLRIIDHDSNGRDDTNG